METERRFPWLLMGPVIATLTAFALTVAINRIFRGGWWPSAQRLEFVVISTAAASSSALVYFRWRQRRTSGK